VLVKVYPCCAYLELLVQLAHLHEKNSQNMVLRRKLLFTLKSAFHFRKIMHASEIKKITRIVLTIKKCYLPVVSVGEPESCRL
jgi:hypothetical protein